MLQNEAFDFKSSLEAPMPVAGCSEKAEMR